MKVKLLREARIRHEAGEIVEVSPVTADYLITVGSAEKIEEKDQPKKTTKKK